MVFTLYMHQQKEQEAITFLQNQYSDTNPEIKLYVLVRELFPYRKKELVIQAIEEAQANSIQPRKKLLEILAKCKTGEMPRYM